MYEDRSYYRGSPESTIVAGRNRINMLNSKRTFWVDLNFTLPITVTVAGTAIRNRGSLLACYDRIGFLEGGSKEHFAGDPRPMRVLAQSMSPSPIGGTRLTSLSTGAYTLEEYFRLPMAWPASVNHTEDAYIEESETAAFAFFADYNPAAADLLTGGSAAITFGTPTIRLTQQGDENRGDRPSYVPRMFEFSKAVPGAQSGFEMKIESDDFIRAMVLYQDSAAGEVTDIFPSFNGLQLKDNAGEIISPDLPWYDLIRQSEAELYGSLASAAPSYWVYNFLRSGRRSQLPQGINNLRIVANVAASAQTAPTIRAQFWTAGRPKGVVKDIVKYPVRAG